MIASLMLMPNAYAHSPPLNEVTYAFCACSPNPVGLGQTINVNFWLNEPTPTANVQYGDRWQGITVKVTLPDGTTTTLGPFTADDTGGTHTTYVPAQLGNYTFQMFFPGQTLAGANPPPTGFSAATTAYIGDYYQPCQSNPATILVQQQPIAFYPTNPLPTNYWTRPINALNVETWYSIAGNWLGDLPSAFANTGCYNGSVNYNPYTLAPTTAHVLWTKPESMGGAIGGEFGGTETSNFYATSQYEPKFAPIIIDGILYYTEYPSSTSNPAGWAAVNLQTGMTLWTSDAPLTLPNALNSASTPSQGPPTVLRCGQVLDYTTPNQYGATGYLWSTGTPAAVAAATNVQSGTTTWNMFDALDGNYILSIVNGSAMTMTEDAGGDLIGYYINNTNINSPTLNEWNSTWCIENYDNITGVNTNVWEWRPPQGGIIPFADGIEWTTPVATSFNGVAFGGTNVIAAQRIALAIQNGGADSGVVLMKAAGPSGIGSYEPGYEMEAGYSSSTGAQLWIKNQTEIPNMLISTGAGTMFVGDGVYGEYIQGALTLTVYSLFTGTQLWSHVLPNARAYDSLGGNSIIANGTIYLFAYGGDVWAYDIATGNLNWQYQTPSGGLESPYAYYSIWCFSVGTVADGMIFLPEGHMYSPPLYHGCQQLALNITNGNLVWSIDAFDVTSAPAISDGVMTTLNAYDNQIYAWGMGPSKTTISAPQVGVTTGSELTLTGSVMDISAGSHQNAVAANFPNGLPCVSDASMSQFMEAVYEQQPMPTNITGVPVTLYVLDSNNNYRSIGTTTTNTLGDYSFTWTPDITGNYTVYATFAGTQSYYGSSASTGFYASPPAATAAPTATPLNGVAIQNSVMYVGVAIIVVIIIIGSVLAILVTRKRP